LIDEGTTHKTYHLHWQPSAKDRKTNPDLPAEVSIEVLVHEVEISPQLTLYLITDLEIDGLSAASLYQRRYELRQAGASVGCSMLLRSSLGVAQRLGLVFAEHTRAGSASWPNLRDQRRDRPPAEQENRPRAEVREKNQLPQPENPLQWS
jgi:hypothetical protein